MVVLHVPDQEAARLFWESLTLGKPRLHLPGMTEFELPGGLLLGLMPEAGIRRLLPALAERGSPPPHQVRAELYLLVEHPQGWLERALRADARLVDELRLRDWGDEAAYVLDPWGHLLAFARSVPQPPDGC